MPTPKTAAAAAKRGKPSTVAKPAAKPVAKPAAKVVARPASQSAAKPAVSPVAKPVVKVQARRAPKTPAPLIVKPTTTVTGKAGALPMAGMPVKVTKAIKASKAPKAAKPVKAPKLRQKPVRDSFTMPEADFALVATLKARAMSGARETKKSELLRAGLHALAALDTPSLLEALNQLDPVKIGRPKKGH